MMFEKDGKKIGYHLQFYNGMGVVGAFGIHEVLDEENLVVELSGKDYDDTYKNVKLGDTIKLKTSDNSETYFITIDHLYYTSDDSAIDIAITSSSGVVKNRLFENDQQKIGYHLQFYNGDAAVGAFGVYNVVDEENLVVELTGKGYNDLIKDAKLGDKIKLVTEDGSATYFITIDYINSYGDNSIIDVAVEKSGSSYQFNGEKPMLPAYDETTVDNKPMLPAYDDSNGKCLNGCDFQNKCLPVGTKIKPGRDALFCNWNNEMVPQLVEGESCQNNYECESNSCMSGKCLDLEKKLQEQQNLLDKILSWLDNFFVR